MTTPNDEHRRIARAAVFSSLHSEAVVNEIAQALADAESRGEARERERCAVLCDEERERLTRVMRATKSRRAAYGPSYAAEAMRERASAIRKGPTP